MTASQATEPWLRGTWTEVPAVFRAVLHALELASEDLDHWCRALSDEQLNRYQDGIAPVAFHIRHIARSVDRLLTYAEGNGLSEAQLAALAAELDPEVSKIELFSELAVALERGAARIRALDKDRLDEPRNVGKNEMPTTLAGLLVHIADHTQRHVGQVITTAKIVSRQDRST
jgi:uncharacterized damage-inducible protein DinB